MERGENRRAEYPLKSEQFQPRVQNGGDQTVMVNVRSKTPNHYSRVDFDGNGHTDLLWQGQDNAVIASWSMSADGRSGTSGLFALNPEPNNLMLKGITSGDGFGGSDLIMQDRAGRIEVWGVVNNEVVTVSPLTQYGLNNYQIEAVGDFNGDGRTDLLWFVPPAPVAGGQDGTWVSASTVPGRPMPESGLGTMIPIPIDFQLVGVGDFDGDGKTDLLFRGTGNASLGTFLIEKPVGRGPESTVDMPTEAVAFHDPGFSWSVLGIADFNGDKHADILWQHVTGARSIWLMNDNNFIGGGMVPNPGSDWSVIGTDDYNNDGKADLLWRSASTGHIGEWLMDGAQVTGGGGSFRNPGDYWGIAAV